MESLGTVGGTFSQALAVSNGGHIVGWSHTSNNQQQHPFFWTSSTNMVDLGTLGGTFSIARAVNTAGLVVGDARNSDGRHRAFAWAAADGTGDIGTFGGSQSGAPAVNDDGEAAGWANRPFEDGSSGASCGSVRTVSWNYRRSAASTASARR
jgi:probable HAF family extracellular repeat protein